MTRPVQFTLGTLPNTSNFTDKVGKNWTQKNIKQFFPPSLVAETESDEDPESQDKADEVEKGGRGKNLRKKRAKSKTKSKPAQKKKVLQSVMMTTARHYEANHILMWTMESIQRTKSDDDTEGPYHFEI